MSRRTKDRRKGKRRQTNQALAEIVQAPEAVTATKETIRKLRTDVIGKLYNAGSLKAEQVDAAEEVAQVYEAWGKCFFPRAKGLDGDSHVGTFLDPVQRLKPFELNAWRDRYKPWADEMGKRCLGRSRNTYLQLVLDVAVDNHGPRQLDEVYSVKNGSCLEALQIALHRYCEIAGWVRVVPAPRPVPVASTLTQGVM